MSEHRIGRRWTDEMFEFEIREAAELLGHFPTNSELLAMQRKDLVHQISRRGGFVHCAQALGIPRIYSDSDKGWDGERAAARRLTELGFDVSFGGAVTCPFDLFVDHVLRIDVKTARLCQYNCCVGWFYRIAKHPQADLILLWRCDEEDYFALPWYICPRTNVTISRGGGKYAEFHNNERIIREMVETRRIEHQNVESRLRKRVCNNSLVKSTP